MNIEIIGAKENNLKNIDVSIPLNKLVVLTGVSGSGKSSLAFDTIHKEGQRRYLETFSSYARSFIGNFERPHVDYIGGLSPVISIEQKSIAKNPRSTVGTITEIYDYLRLLYAKISTPVSFNTKKKMVKQDQKNILNTILKEYLDQDILIFSPLIKSRKGHYSELFQSLIKKGYLKARVNNELIKLTPNLKLDRYKTHDIEVVIDKLTVKEKTYSRLKNSIQIALSEAKGSLIIQNLKTGNQKYFSEHLTCEKTGIYYQSPEPNSFSFNSPKGYCQKCKGLGEINEIDISNIIPNYSININNGGIVPIGEYKPNWIFQQIEIISKKFNFNLNTKIKDIPKEGLNFILYGGKDQFKVKNKNIGITKKYAIDFQGVISFIKEQYENNKSIRITKWSNQFFTKKKCPNCKGRKLKRESLHFLINKNNISEISEYDIFELKEWCNNIMKTTKKNKLIITNEIMKELLNRLDFLINIGLGYITTARSSSSLSGGESQRIRIASQIGSELTNVLYILDEPSIGLHPIDNELLINSLKKLKNLGNSVIVVEHDKSMIQSADHIIDIGPGAGQNGGEVIFNGNYKNLQKSNSLTSQYLSNQKKMKTQKKPRLGSGKKIILNGATGNNLKNISISIPLGKLVLITGVSGSGKSTLINGTLYPVVSNRIHHSVKKSYPYNSIEGIENIDKIININQNPIGRSPRSNPVTYIGAFTEIRELYANLNESKIRGYKLGRFSFNVKEGNCTECEGNGYILIRMKLLPDMETPCKSCSGKRFNKETLEVKYNKKNIYQVLQMSVDEGVVFFEKIPKIKNKLQALKDVGMGYIKMGQSSKKLSGGEAQRIKLASELAKKSTGNTLYILDEPTTGLHFHDINILMNSINLLVEKGNTVIIIEHNMDVIKQGDYIIDLGLKGGKEGGNIIFEGELKGIMKNKISQTGFFLKKEISSQNE